MGTPFDPTNPLHRLIFDADGNPVPQVYDPEANDGQGGMVVVNIDDVQKVEQIGSVTELYGNDISERPDYTTIIEPTVFVLMNENLDTWISDGTNDWVAI